MSSVSRNTHPEENLMDFLRLLAYPLIWGVALLMIAVLAVPVR